MPSNFDHFEKTLTLFAQNIVPQDHHLLIKKLSLEVLRRIVLKTPVDTGRARSNWLVAVNSTPQGIITIDKLSPGEAANLALNNGIPIIESSQAFSTISIANNLPYIGLLEFGHSKQAPQGMVRITLAEIESLFNTSA